ncbi:MAG TPA: DUF4340 domain-containing protein [Nitrospirae bacterium]|nr:DUF4340 domain-containing protein [Nitrospirota bacterium]
MNYFKTTFWWIIVLAAVGGYSYLDYEKTRVEEIQKDEATRLFPFYPKDILSIILNKGDRVIELERWEEGWRMVAPIKVKAESKAVEKFLGYITDSRNDADYIMDPDPSPQRLVEFGLADPEVSVTLKVGKQLNEYTLQFGARAPTKGVAFARLKGEKAVYRVLSYMRAEADKDVYYFRDKSVLRLNPLMIDQLVINRKEGSIRVKLPQDGKWEIEKPIKARADHNKVFEILGMFANAQVKNFISENKNNLKAYGLDKPDIELMLWQSGDSEPTLKIEVGARNPEKRGYFVSMSDRDNVFLLEEDLISAIPRGANDLRSRDLLFFESDKLRRIEIRRPNRSVALVRDKDKEWRKNNVDGEKVDFNLVKEMLSGVLELKISDFITDSPKSLKAYGLDPPEMKLLLWPEKSAVPIFLSVGSKTPSGNVYAMSGAQGSVLALDKSVKRILKIIL